jgi:hypothetical protein
MFVFGLNFKSPKNLKKMFTCFRTHRTILKFCIGYGIFIENENRVTGKSNIGIFGRQGDTYAVIGQPSNLVYVDCVRKSLMLLSLLQAEPSLIVIYGISIYIMFYPYQCWKSRLGCTLSSVWPDDACIRLFHRPIGLSHRPPITLTSTWPIARQQAPEWLWQSTVCVFVHSEAIDW